RVQSLTNIKPTHLEIPNDPALVDIVAVWKMIKTIRIPKVVNRIDCDRKRHSCLLNKRANDLRSLTIYCHRNQLKRLSLVPQVETLPCGQLLPAQFPRGPNKKDYPLAAVV